MCQMPNIWHIYHTNNQKPSLSDTPNAIIFTIYEQYRFIFATVRTKMVYWIIFFYSLLSLLSLQFILFSSLSPLFSLTDSLLSHLCHRRSFIADRHRRSLTGCILHRHRRSLRASSSSSSIGIDVGINVEVRSVCSSRSWASTLRWGEILIVGCRC